MDIEFQFTPSNITDVAMKNYDDTASYDTILTLTKNQENFNFN